MFCFNHPPLLTRPCSSLSRHQTQCLCLTRPINVFLGAGAGAGAVGFVWGFCALPDLMPPKNAAETISKAIRKSDIRQTDIRQPNNQPHIKKQRKTINRKQGKAQPGPPSHGETATARASRMSRCRSTCPRNAKFSNRGNEPWTSIEWQLSTTNMALNT